MDSQTSLTHSQRESMGEIDNDINKPQETVWMWNSKVDPSSNFEPDEWTPYSDVENYIIESAYQQNKNEVELDDHCIDLNKQVQILKHDSNKQRPIKRMMVKINEYVRSERFTLQQPELTNKSFSVRNYVGGISQFLYASGYAKAEKVPDDELNDLVEKAAAGIEEEGTKLGKKIEAQFFANELRKQNGKGKQEIGKCCVRLYTMESFLYKLFNQVMRDAEVTEDRDFDRIMRKPEIRKRCESGWVEEETERINNCGYWFLNERDKNYGRTLGPYCSLLRIYFDISPNQKDIIVFRSVRLTNEMLGDYRKHVGKIIKWESFSSTTKNKQKALKFKGNTLFQIYIDRESNYRCVDISSSSKYPYEEEVLLSPGIDIMINQVEYDPEINKYIIHLKTCF